MGACGLWERAGYWEELFGGTAALCRRTLRECKEPYGLTGLEFRSTWEEGMMAEAEQPQFSQHLLELNQRLLDCIAQADWATYQQLCDPTLSAFEPEAAGALVEGLEFHRQYFTLGPAKEPQATTMASPQVRLLGDDVAVITYIRLNQRLDPDGQPLTIPTEETRIWHRQPDGNWRHVHFHRSAAGPVWKANR